ncbi:MAG: prepilin-type N-terminal cleavage/methylation domain-containing protein [Pirellulales bacterium]|nr:prepilin-type N-terminal cleavage/methylation domain-containing protein [Pirellulales bacterium]
MNSRPMNVTVTLRKRGQSPFAGTALRVLCTKGDCPLFRPMKPRRGLTLVELMIGMAVMSIIAVMMTALSSAVFVGAEYADEHGLAVQHARVALERISRTVREAKANNTFPGFLVLTKQVSTWYFPNTLVVWRPSSAAPDIDGVPQFNELVIFCPHPDDPHRLVEITAPTNVNTVPALSNLALWRTQINLIKTSADSKIVTLTNLMRVCAVNGSANIADQQGNVWFVSRLLPSKAELDDYYADGSPTWDELSWVQGIYGSETGLRQNWVRMELQLMPGTESFDTDPGGESAIPFFDSAALYYEYSR